jgi:serine/threonine-protein kinase RsbT
VPPVKHTRLEVRSQENIVHVRQAVRALAVQSGFSLIDQTKMITAASELARNMFTYGGGGTVLVECLEEGARQGIRLTFEDNGPGIQDIGEALRDGFTTGKGLGLGLSGAKRLSSEFHIESSAGKGTRVVATRWKG